MVPAPALKSSQCRTNSRDRKESNESCSTWKVEDYPRSGVVSPYALKDENQPYRRRCSLPYPLQARVALHGQAFSRPSHELVVVISGFFETLYEVTFDARPWGMW